MVSSDWNGQIEGLETATWNSLSAVIASKHDESRIFIDSGNLSLNFYGRELFFAFKYTGSGKTSQDGTYELDDFHIFDK